MNKSITTEDMYVVRQQFLGQDVPAFFEDELVYYNPSMNCIQLLEILNVLSKADEVRVTTVSTPDEYPDVVYEATYEMIRTLSQSNVLNDVAVWRALYDQVEQTDRTKNLQRLRRGAYITGEIDPAMPGDQ